MLSQLIRDLSPEGELLLCCTRTQIDLVNAEKIKNLIKQDINWEYLLQLGEKHRVIPLIYSSLKSSCPDSIPPDIWQSLRKRFHENTRNNLIISQEIFRLINSFQTQNIPLIPYKGTVLAAAIYNKVALRQVWDIDLLVAKHNVERACNLLLAEGYEHQETCDREQNFFHSKKNVEVDLHWGFTPFYFPVNIDFASLWSKVEAIELLGKKVNTFCVEDLLLILCIQIAKDCWERRLHIEHLLKVCDIAELLRSFPLLRWTEIFVKARQQGSLRMLHFGLFLAQNLLAIPLPKAIENRVQQDYLAVSLGCQVSQRLFSTIDESFAPVSNSLFDFKFRWQQLLFYLKMRERPQDWWQHFREIHSTIIKLSTNYLAQN